MPKIIIPREGPLRKPIPIIRQFPVIDLPPRAGGNLLKGYDADGNYYDEYEDGNSGFSLMDFMNTPAGLMLTNVVAQVGAKGAGINPIYNQYGTNPYGLAAGPKAPYSLYNPTGYKPSTISPMLIIGALAVGAFLLMRKK